MPEIVKIIIKGSSGYCCIDEAYIDKVVITPEAISYEFTPVKETENNAKRKWSYKTNSPIFKMRYNTIVRMIPCAVERDDEGFCTDIGGIEFSITYDDKTNFKKTFWIPSDRFEELFKVIMEMVPENEYTPAVLLTSKDCEEDELI